LIFFILRTATKKAELLKFVTLTMSPFGSPAIFSAEANQIYQHQLLIDKRPVVFRPYLTVSLALHKKNLLMALIASEVSYY
jgi:hypothetical protein